MLIFHSSYIQLSCAVLLFCFALDCLANDIEVKIKGITGELKKNVELSIDRPTNKTELSALNYRNKLPQDIASALQALGFYEPVIDIQSTHKTDEKHSVELLTVTIQAGPEVKIRSFNMQLIGEAKTDPIFKEILQNAILNVGDTLHHGLYELTKHKFLEAAQDRGYFNGQFTKKSVIVDKETSRADIELTFDSGRRYHIGEILIESDKFDEAFIRRWIPFKPGRAYESKLITEMTYQLQASDYFSKVRIQTLYDKSQNYSVPISIKLTANPSNKVGIGLGFATDTGLRSKLTWKRPHNNNYGHSLNINTGISEISQEASLQYKIPQVIKPLTNYWQFDVGALNEQTEDTESQLRTLNLQHVRQTPRLWQESTFLRWEHEKFRAGDEKGTVNLVLPGISWSRTRTRGGLNPSWGDQFSLQILGGSKTFFSDIDILKSVISLKWLRTLYPKHKLILSLDYGAISSDEFEKLPSTHRFYVGGDHSIRGYKYNSISPKNSSNELTGGRYKELASAEYDYQLADDWSVALFVDAGRAFDHFDEAYHVGAGFGVRWYSPVGPLRLDLGFGVSEDDTPYQLHLSIGPDLQ